MKQEIEAFKNELKNYQFYLDEYDAVSKEIELMIYQMSGVKGIDYSKQSGNSFNESASEIKRLSMIEQLNELEIEKKEISMMILRINRKMSSLTKDERNLLMRLIVDKKTYEEICDELQIANKSLLYNEINKIIEKAIKKRGR